MSLKDFHVVFISASVLLALGFGAWCLVVAPQAEGWGPLPAIVSFAASAVLVGYEAWFLRKARRLP
jgi:hypothetical protein